MPPDAPFISLKHSATVQQVRMQAALKAVVTVREKFTAFLESIDIPTPEVDDWKLVITELLNNAIIHGARQDEEKTIIVEWSLRQGVVLLSVQDPGNGPPTAFTSAISLPNNPGQEHGRGQFIVQSLVDQVREWRSDAGYRIEVEKNCISIEGFEPPSEEMEAILNELSTSYEALAAFYQLSESLAHSDSLGDFLTTSFINVRDSLELDYLRFHTDPGLSRLAQKELDGASKVINDERQLAPLRELMEQHSEIVWENEQQRSALRANVAPLDEFSSGCLLPIASGGNFFGLLVAGRCGSAPHITSSQVNNLRTFADIFGVSIANYISAAVRREAEKDLHELEIAAQIQQHLLPIRQPATSMKRRVRIFQRAAQNVAGDYAEYCQDRLGNHYVTIIDVMGKGVSAALLGIIYRATFNLLLDYPKPLPVMLQQIGRILNHMLDKLTMFITVTILRWNDDTDLIEHVNAGHCRTLLVSWDGSIRQYGSSGPPIGLMTDYAYECDSIVTKPDDRIILVSDGCYEWDCKGEEFGWERLVDMIREGNYPYGAQLWNDLCQRMDHKNESETPNDDATLVFLKTKQG